MKARWYQQEAVDSIWGYYATGGKGNTLIALPTGTGKSFVNTLLIKSVLDRFPNQRILCLTHVKELIEQNYASLIRDWSIAPAGIYSASVGRKDVGFPITFAGIQTIHKKGRLFKKTDIILVDEAHLISSKSGSMYSDFISDLKEFNPNLVIWGMTATPYRVGQGMLTQGDGALFTDICYDQTGMDAFNRFISEGFLCPLTPLKTKTELDTEGLKIVAGEFTVSEMQSRFNIDDITKNAINETIRNGRDRNHWLIFATGLEHCEAITEMLNLCGIPAASIHSKLKKDDRERIISQYKNGELRAVVNNNVLTTGFDFPKIDLISVLRPTNSPGLWVQMLGRGTRPHESKKDCLVLDFAANTKRLGPINDPILPTPPSKRAGPKREAPVKICENCGAYNHTSVRRCVSCDEEFPRSIKIRSVAAQEELIRTSQFVVKCLKVKQMDYGIHEKKNKPNSLRLRFVCGLHVYSTWLCFDHPEPAASNARKWWRESTGADNPPRSTDDAMLRIAEIICPLAIRVRLDTKHPEILDYDFRGDKFYNSIDEI